ncbi:hypothetical protein [Streptomyces sp. WMMB303]|uniref:hypothetical protein n=1 Tax=Streptomyces sp. WMMB303 TaxID=3034154 RepID=UPI0023EC84A3|nr:hypothetical protein [Streptomyces sp. WMMB303]MDF4252153.1 hypothetical protein [Streptomyces sp. WMMB303]
MKVRRKAAGLVAGVGMAAGTMLATVPAAQAQAPDAVQATGSAERVGSGQRATVPPAPVNKRASAGITATSPKISPSAGYKYVVSAGSYTCDYGNLCTPVWDPTVGKWKVFFLYYCNTYSLSYWNGEGNYYNNQTTGTKAHFYNSSGGTYQTSTAPDPNRPIDWDPVWKIKNC